MVPFPKNVGSTISKTLLLFLAVTLAAGQSVQAPLVAGADERFKVDLLVIVAHPDDETGDIAGYLARVIYDQERRVGVIFITDAQGGINGIGREEGNALGAEREIEGRRALGSLGIDNVWFLNAPNVNTQNGVNSLERWGHGAILEQVVRLIRLTRPEVVLTWLPAFVAGENHADHQAASVIANEAFDLAGDPSTFIEQLLPDRTGAQSGEGLTAWQPKKIYYYSDTIDYPDYGQTQQIPSPYRKPFVEGKGPVYSNTEISRAKHIPYSRFAAQETSFYLTQVGKVGAIAIEKQDFKEFERPARFILGKSLVGGSTTGDVFEGVVPGAIPFGRVTPSNVGQRQGVSVNLGGPWNFYNEFWRAHNLEHLGELLPVAEMAVRPDAGYLYISLLIRNDTDTSKEVTLTSVLPNGWEDKTPYHRYVILPGRVYPVRSVFAPANTSGPAWHEITWKASVNGGQRSSVVLRLFTGATGVMAQ